MGNRFKGDHYYKHLIVAHGIFAAIVFLFLIPMAIIVARFHSNGYWAVRIHAGLQIMSLFALTIVFVLGWYAVGNERKLTNPHHGIGLAIYVLFWFQFLWGWLVHFYRKKHAIARHLLIAFVSRNFHSNCLIHKYMSLILTFSQLHRWLGRAIALLGIIQIPLGLCLYGSPLALFVIYAITVFFLILIYAFLTYRHETLEPAYSTESSTLPSSDVSRRYRRHGHIVDPSSSSDPSSVTPPGRFNEKPAYAAAAPGLMSRWFGPGRQRPGNYAPAPVHDRPDGYGYANPPGRLEEGRPPPHRPPPSMEPSTLTGTTDSEFGPRHHHHPDGKAAAAGAVLGAGALAAVSRFMRSHKDKREQKRIDDLRQQDIENERLMRQNSNARRHSRDTTSRSPRRPHHKAKNSASSISGTSDLETEPTEPGRSDLTHTYTTPSEDIVAPVSNPKRRHGATTGVEPGRPEASNSRRRVSGRRDESPDSRVSPADVSLHMKIHDGDNRSVTLRRLTPDEAAAARRSKTERKKREEREKEQRQSSRSRSRHAADRRRSKSRPAHEAPYGLDPISEVSSNSNTHTTSTKDTAWLNMEARERYEQEQMDREKKRMGKQPIHPDPLGPGGIATSAPPPPVVNNPAYGSPQHEYGRYGEGIPGQEQQYGHPGYTYDPEQFSQSPGDYPTESAQGARPSSSYLPGTHLQPHPLQPYRRSYDDQTYGQPSYGGEIPPSNVTFADQLPPRHSRNTLNSQMSGMDTDASENRHSRRDRRRTERRSRERSASRGRSTDEWD